MSQAATPLHKVRLTDLAGCGGCAAKADPNLVGQLTELMGTAVDPSVLVGLTPGDDAAVYKIDDQKAIVASLDFFPPLVDEPAAYGEIAVANAVSDIYAMGGEPTFGLTISGFPADLDREIIKAVNQAAAQKMTQCGAVVLGGHSIRCKEPVFGMCVIGFVNPNKIWRKSGAKVGDIIVMSKSLGTGVLLSQAAPDGVQVAIASMEKSNKNGAAALAACHPTAVTDITGYGLAGHASEMALQSDVRLQLETRQVPLLAGALAAAKAGFGTSADGNLKGNPRVSFGVVPKPLVQLMCDPQTSGGLLASVSPDAAASLEEHGFRPIGAVVSGPAGVDFV